MIAILCAAIHYDDGIKYEHQPVNITTGFVVAGRRHHNAILTLYLLRGEENLNKEYMGKDSQGFLTSDDRYVTRKEAFRIAKAAGQLLLPSMFDPSDNDISLLSEDLY